MEENILDSVDSEIKNFKYFKFQIIEFVLIGLFCFILLVKSTMVIPVDGNFFVFFCFSIILYSFVRIFFEFKNNLITGAGIVLKIILALNASTLFMGLLFKIMSLNYATEMLAVSLVLFPILYSTYAITLKNVSFPFKAILFFNALAIGTIAIARLFRLESWPNVQVLSISGFILTIISLIALFVILKKEASIKEKYHATNYIARSFVMLLWGMPF